YAQAPDRCPGCAVPGGQPDHRVGRHPDGLAPGPTPGRPLERATSPSDRVRRFARLPCSRKHHLSRIGLTSGADTARLFLLACSHRGVSHPFTPPALRLPARPAPEELLAMRSFCWSLGLATLLLPGPARAEASLEERARTHWAFRPIRTPAIPTVKDRAWPR